MNYHPDEVELWLVDFNKVEFTTYIKHPLPHVKNIYDLRKKDPGFGERVVVIGAGQVGCETSVHLLQEGHQVTLVGSNADYAKDATIWHKHGLRQQLFGRAEIKLSSSVVEITEDHVVTEDKEGNRN